MSEENGCEVMETIDEIVREMRIIGSIEEKPTDQIPNSFQSPGLRMFADRIEAAHRREREAGEQTDRYEKLCDSHTCGSRCSGSNCPLYDYDCSPFCMGADAVRGRRSGMSGENRLTVADIVAEMREFADTDSQTIGRDVLRKRIQDFARRIEQSVTDCNRIGNFEKEMRNEQRKP